jgi:hypothetical protein
MRAIHQGSEFVQSLVARVEAKVRNHDADSVFASSASPVSAAITPAASSEPEFKNHIQTHNADLASLATFAAVPEYHVSPKTRGPRPRTAVTTSDGLVSVSSYLSSSSTSKHKDFRQLAFATGRRHLAENRLGEVPLSRIIDEFKAANPSEVVPASLHACIQWDNFIRAVTHNDIALLELRRPRDPTREVQSMQDKFSLRPDLARVVDWCMAWIRGAREKHVTPSLTDMLTAWQREKDHNPNSTFLNGRITTVYALDQCAVHWNCYMEYEKRKTRLKASPAGGLASSPPQRQPPPPAPRRPPPTHLLLLRRRGLALPP